MKVQDFLETLDTSEVGADVLKSSRQDLLPRRGERVEVWEVVLFIFRKAVHLGSWITHSAEWDEKEVRFDFGSQGGIFKFPIKDAIGNWSRPAYTILDDGIIFWWPPEEKREGTLIVRERW